MRKMLEVKNIYAKFGDFQLKDISFVLPKGKHMAIVGPTGAGKTSLMEIIAGVRKHRSGNIILNGREIGQQPPHKRNISMLYQHLSLFPHYNVLGNITYPLRWKKNRDINPMTIAQKLKIEHLLNKRIQTLSGGEKQRVALARALVSKPQVLILDEPLSSIDVVTKEDIIITIKDIQKTFSLSTIIITHSPEEAYTLADFIAIIRKGKLVRFDTKDEVWNNPIDTWFAKMIGIKNIIPIDVWKTIYPQKLPYKEYSHVGIKPEDITVDEKGDLEGDIVDIIRFPNRCELDISIRNIKLLASSDLYSCQQYSQGDKIHISIANGNIYLLKEGSL